MKFHGMFLFSFYALKKFETKYLEPVLKNRSLEIMEFRGDTEEQRRILEKLKDAARLQEEEDTEFQTRIVFSEIWLLLLREMKSVKYGRPPVQPERQERLQAMLNYIRENFEKKLSLDQIAGAAFVGKRECLRCFRSCMGKTPFEYLLEYRVEMSRKLLRDTKLSAAEIAEQTGFSSAAYFGKVFRRLCHMTPGVYRRQMRKQ